MNLVKQSVFIAIGYRHPAERVSANWTLFSENVVSIRDTEFRTKRLALFSPESLTNCCKALTITDISLFEVILKLK